MNPPLLGNVAHLLYTDPQNIIVNPVLRPASSATNILEYRNFGAHSASGVINDFPFRQFPIFPLLVISTRGTLGSFDKTLAIGI